jgi:hypothetical protein
MFKNPIAVWCLTFGLLWITQFGSSLVGASSTIGTEIAGFAWLAFVIVASQDKSNE